MTQPESTTRAVAANLREFADVIEAGHLPLWVRNRIVAWLAPMLRTAREARDRGLRPTMRCSICIRTGADVEEFDDLAALLAHGREAHDTGGTVADVAVKQPLLGTARSLTELR